MVSQLFLDVDLRAVRIELNVLDDVLKHFVAGNLNRHPKTSLAYMQDDSPLREKGIVAFYNQQVAMEDID